MPMTQRIMLSFILSIAALPITSQAARRNMVQVKGSDTMVNLAQAWAEEYMKEHPGELIAVTGGGSGTGISSLMASSADVAMCSRNIKPKEIELAEKKGIKPREFKVALDGLAIVVNPNNPVSKLTIGQLADIFTGRVNNWKDVGGRDAKIVILSREVNSGTHVYLKEHVLRKGDPNSKEEFASTALMLSSSQAIADEVAQNPDAIGYYGMGYICNKQKPIEIAKEAAGPYFAPTVENVIKGDYPISRPLLFYSNGEPKESVKGFIDFTLSKKGQEIALMNDFVPITSAPPKVDSGKQPGQ